jgi:hypothetical protein
MEAEFVGRILRRTLRRGILFHFSPAHTMRGSPALVTPTSLPLKNGRVIKQVLHKKDKRPITEGKETYCRRKRDLIRMDGSSSKRCTIPS